MPTFHAGARSFYQYNYLKNIAKILLVDWNVSVIQHDLGGVMQPYYTITQLTQEFGVTTRTRAPAASADFTLTSESAGDAC